MEEKLRTRIKIRYKFCINKLGNPQFLRAIHGQSGAALDAKLHSNIKNQVFGPVFCVKLDLLLITGLSWKEVLSQEESAVKEEGKLASLRQNERQKCAECRKLLDLRIAQDKGL